MCILCWIFQHFVRERGNGLNRWLVVEAMNFHHWLPVRKRVEFMVATLVGRALSGHALCYLADTRRRILTSSDSRTLLVSRTLTNLGGRAFSAAGPRVWNYCRRTSDIRTAVSDSRWRHFYSVIGTKAQCESHIDFVLKIVLLTHRVAKCFKRTDVHKSRWWC